MRTLEKISAGENYNAVAVGEMAQLGEYTLQIAPDCTIPGKVFVGAALAATGAELSFQSYPPGSETGFLHTHKSHEEIYIFIKGKGEFQVDGSIFPITEGAIVRVAQKGKRSVRNTGNDSLVMICVQYKADTFNENDAFDGEILQEKVVW